MIWYYLILPHTFLMNTSHNKDLIVDNGWKTTLRNALSLPISFRRRNLNQSIEQNEGLGTAGKENTIQIAVISNSKELCRDEEASELCNISSIKKPELASSSGERDKKSDDVPERILNKKNIILTTSISD